MFVTIHSIVKNITYFFISDCSPAKDAGSKQGGEQKTKKNPSAPTVITTER